MRRGYTLLWRKIWANPMLQEREKRFSRMEAWLYRISVLATGVDAPDSCLKRGEFRASVRQLAGIWNWSPTSVFRFLSLLEENSMISRVEHQAGHPAEQGAEHFTVCNYATYNPERNSKRNADRNTQRNTYKEGIKEGFKEVEKKDTHVPSSDGDRVSSKTLFEIYRQQNQSLPEVKALTSERLKKSRSRIGQAVRDGCLEQYLADFKEVSSCR